MSMSRPSIDIIGEFREDSHPLFYTAFGDSIKCHHDNYESTTVLTDHHSRSATTFLYKRRA